FFSSRRRHTRCYRDWSSDVCSSDLIRQLLMDRIIAIHKKLPNCHLVMHGSSSVPQDLQEELRKYGGDMKQTWGVPVEEIQKGIQIGRASCREIGQNSVCEII